MSGRAKLLLVVIAVVVGLMVLSMLRGGGSDLDFVAPAAERAAIDAGEPGASLGDMNVFGGPLLSDDGDPAGRIDGTCTVTSLGDSEDERRQRCEITLTIGTANGETELQLAAVGRLAADDVIFSVLGGSGRYSDARGDATFDYSGERTRITVELDD